MNSLRGAKILILNEERMKEEIPMSVAIMR